MTGIYVHVPFCLRKCPYCSFFSQAYDESCAEEYVRAVCRNFEDERYFGVRADTLYFGGGTPSVLTAGQIGRITASAAEHFGLDDNSEITLEANPCTVDDRKLRELRAVGINRISFGIQSVQDSELEFLGRLHTSADGVRAVDGAYKAGIKNISADLMIGLAAQTKNGLTDTLKQLVGLPLSHISAYILKVEEGTPFDLNGVSSLLPDEDAVCELYLEMAEMLESNGFLQYEISNFAKSGYESRHNMKYWTGEDYIGFGPSAHSLYKGRRFFVPESLPDFLSDSLQREIDEDIPYDAKTEYVMLGLRLRKGIDTKTLSTLFGRGSADSIMLQAKQLEKADICRVFDGNISLTPKGFLVSNSVISRFLDTIVKCD